MLTILKIMQLEEIWKGKEARKGRQQVLEEHWLGIQDSSRGNRRFYFWLFLWWFASFNPLSASL